MTEPNLIEDQITGLKSRLKELRELERKQIKVSTITEQIEKAHIDLGACKEKANEAKKKKQAIVKDKRKALKESALPFAEAITKMLPRGEAVVEIGEKVFIAWENEGNLTPYLGLSGGEKVFFDGALKHAMLKDSPNKIIILEAAEMDAENLVASLNHIAVENPGVQVIVNTWAGDMWPEKTYAAIEALGWKVVQL